MLPRVANVAGVEMGAYLAAADRVVTVDGRVIGADRNVVDGLHVVGPSTKGTLWESTAIPEIRAQAAQVAAAVHRDLAVTPVANCEIRRRGR